MRVTFIQIEKIISESDSPTKKISKKLYHNLHDWAKGVAIFSSSKSRASTGATLGARQKFKHHAIIRRRVSQLASFLKNLNQTAYLLNTAVSSLTKSED